jgi:hypothetical protein
VQVNDTTPPINVTTVNDGTGADIDTTALTTQLSANWTASSDPESGLSGYKYAIGTTAGGTGVAGWTSNTGTNVTRTGLTLTVGTRYYYTVKAVNGKGLESGATNSNGQVVISGPDVTAPRISSVSAGNITETGATITWDTDENATSKVQYGKSASYGSARETINLVTSHSITLADLTPNTQYHYKVSGKDGVGNEGSSPDCVFTTSMKEIKVRVYPNPFVFISGGNMTFMLEETKGADLKIYTISGKLVKKLAVGSGQNQVNWNLSNEAGKSIIPGLYLYVVTDSAGNRKAGKLVITK